MGNHYIVAYLALLLHRLKTDLKVVKSRIEAGAFRSIHEFQHALCTMFLNVQMMHPVGTEVSETRTKIGYYSELAKMNLI